MVTLAVVVPCFNEEAVIQETAQQLSNYMQSLIDRGVIDSDSHIYFVDDGSYDRTWELISQLSAHNPIYRGVKLSRNKGHQNALLAGLYSAQEDVVVSLDADLQDDYQVMEKMLEDNRSGSDIVFGVRSKRTTDTFFKRFTAEFYYWFLSKLGVDIIFNHADFRLMSRKTIEALKEYSEVNIFLRGIIPQLGFRTSIVSYERNKRTAGESKYNLRKMIKLAWEGVTSFTNMPLRMITAMGFLVSLFSLVVIVWVLFQKFVSQNVVPGWASTLIPILFLGGVQLVSVGILGEYISKIYLETKRRPRYHIERTTFNADASQKP